MRMAGKLLTSPSRFLCLEKKNCWIESFRWKNGIFNEPFGISAFILNAYRNSITPLKWKIVIENGWKVGVYFRNTPVVYSFERISFSFPESHELEYYVIFRQFSSLFDNLKYSKFRSSYLSQQKLLLLLLLYVLAFYC